MVANNMKTKTTRGRSNMLAMAMVLFGSLLVIISFFLPWFSHDRWQPSGRSFVVSGTMLATGRFYSVYANYPQTPQETFWLLWLLPLCALFMAGLVLATEYKPSYAPRSLLVWSISPLLGLVLILVFLYPMITRETIDYGYWLEIAGFALLLIGGWLYRKRALAAPLEISDQTRLSRRRILGGMAGLVGVLAIGGIAFYWMRFAREHIPTYSNYSDPDIQGVNVVAWSPNSKQLATAKGTEVQIWDTATWKQLQTLKVTTSDSSAILGMAWSPDGKYIAGGQIDGTVSVWEVATGTVIFTKTRLASYIAWSVDSQSVVVASQATPGIVLQTWSITTGSHVLDFHLSGQQGREYHTVASSRDGNFIASGGAFFGGQKEAAKVLDVWDAHTGNLLFSQHADAPFGITTIAWSPDNIHIAYAGAGNGVVIVDVQTQKTVLTYNEYSEAVVVAWSPDGKRIASDAGSPILVWDAITGDTLFAYEGHADSIRSIAWSPDATSIASAERAGFQVWQP